jgi:hypothetical protein
MVRDMAVVSSEADPTLFLGSAEIHTGWSNNKQKDGRNFMSKIQVDKSNGVRFKHVPTRKRSGFGLPSWFSVLIIVIK